MRQHIIQIQGRDPEEIKATEERKRREQEDKKLNKIAQPKQKKYYTVNVECITPCIITYRIYAEDENDAINQVNKAHPINIKPNINLKKLIKATVYDSGSSLIRLIKNFRV